MKKIQIAATLAALTILPMLVMAQTPPPINFVPVQGEGIDQVVNIIKNIGRWMLYALLILAGIFIVYAAYLYLTAAGDTTKVKHASDVIIYAAVAIGVGLLSQVIVAIAQALVD